MINKETYIKIATLLPIITQNIMVKRDIMDAAEMNFLNNAHKDFRRMISSGQIAMRKNEEWAIQKAFKDGLVKRTNKRGEYYITQKGIDFVEDFSANININKSIASNYYTQWAINAIENFYLQRATSIATRQAKEVRVLLGM